MSRLVVVGCEPFVGEERDLLLEHTTLRRTWREMRVGDGSIAGGWEGGKAWVEVV